MTAGWMVSRFIAASVALFAVFAPAHAQPYPSRPVTLIVPFPAGGPSDVVARILIEALRGPLGQPIIIENVSGAGGSIGIARLARSTPDGYTIGLGHVQTHVINPATQNVTFDPVADFEPVTLIVDTPQLLVGRANLPASDVRELIAWMKANAGKVSAGSVGVGGPSDIAAIDFQKRTGTSFTLVPYRGGAPMIQDLIAGQIDFTFGQAPNYIGQVRSGKLKPFGVLAAQRWKAAPDVPTLEEAGGPSLHSSFWHGLWAPKGTPREIVEKLNGAMQAALKDPDLKRRYDEIGQEIFPPDRQNPQALAAMQKSESDRWVPIIKANGIKSE